MFEYKISPGILLSVNATIIAGILILLAVGSTSEEPTIKFGNQEFPSNALISMSLLPFIMAAVILVRISIAKPEKQEKLYKRSIITMIVGLTILLLFIYFVGVISIVNSMNNLAN